jgi:hypothetical protein
VPALTNPKYERAAQLLASGQTKADAYKGAGFSYKPASASRLFNRPEIVERIAEIIADNVSAQRKGQEIAVKKAGVTIEWVLERLKFNAERALRGQPVLDANGRHTGQFMGKIDGAVANRALELIGQHLGMFVTRHEVGAPGDFARMSDDELNLALAEQARAMGLPESQIAMLLSDRSGETDSTLN